MHCFGLDGDKASQVELQCEAVHYVKGIKISCLQNLNQSKGNVTASENKAEICRKRQQREKMK